MAGELLAIPAKLTECEAAALIGVSVATLRRQERAHRIRAFQDHHKRRALVPMVEPIVPLIIAAGPGYIVNDDGRRLDDIKSAWRRARSKAGLGDHVQAKFIRHTVSSRMARDGVPKAQRDAWRGHTDTSTEGWRYETLEPQYLSDAAASIEALISEMGRAGGPTHFSVPLASA